MRIAKTGRELLTPDEVRMLDNQYALLFVRGERPVKDFKYNLKEHPNVDKTPIGSGKTYIHGQTYNSTGSISLNLYGIDLSNEKIIEVPVQEKAEYELLTNEEIENYLKQIENEKT